MRTGQRWILRNYTLTMYFILALSFTLIYTSLGMSWHIVGNNKHCASYRLARNTLASCNVLRPSCHLLVFMVYLHLQWRERASEGFTYAGVLSPPPPLVELHFGQTAGTVCDSKLCLQLPQWYRVFMASPFRCPIYCTSCANTRDGSNWTAHTTSCH